MNPSKRTITVAWLVVISLRWPPTGCVCLCVFPPLLPLSSPPYVPSVYKTNDYSCDPVSVNQLFFPFFKLQVNVNFWPLSNGGEKARERKELFCAVLGCEIPFHHQIKRAKVRQTLDEAHYPFIWGSNREPVISRRRPKEENKSCLWSYLNNFFKKKRVMRRQIVLFLAKNLFRFPFK